MRLVHYSQTPVGELRMRDPWETAPLKPAGLWVSDDDCEDNWPAWCAAENFRLEDLAVAHDVELVADANVLILRSPADIDSFTAEWRRRDHQFEMFRSGIFLDWDGVRERYDGLIITPYIWARRLEGFASWYYGWDCASGCVWNPAAIASIRVRASV